MGFVLDVIKMVQILLQWLCNSMTIVKATELHIFGFVLKQDLTG